MIGLIDALSLSGQVFPRRAARPVAAAERDRCSPGHCSTGRRTPRDRQETTRRTHGQPMISRHSNILCKIMHYAKNYAKLCKITFTRFYCFLSCRYMFQHQVGLEEWLL